MWSFLKLVAWGVLWTPFWLVTAVFRKLIKRPRLDNCLSWALRKWTSEGGYLVIRWCRSNKITFIRWPHFLWLPPDKHQELKHFIPKVENQHLRFVPDPWFEGKIQTGDSENIIEN